MSKRAALLASVLVVDCLCFLPIRLGYAPRYTSIGRVAMISGPSLVLCAVALAVALGRGLYTRAELGLEATEFMKRRGLVGWRYAVLLTAIFIVAALIHMFPPINYSIVHGFSYAEFVDELRRHEWRSTFARSEQPVDPVEVVLVFLHSVVFAPLTEEIPYRALFVPAVLPRLGRHLTALASGLVFLGLHTVVYGLTPDPSYFLGGLAFAYVFMYAGLAGAIVCHAGGNFGIWLLAMFVEFWA